MPELPSGTVTFLFTDVEGSTRLLKQLREGYSEVLTAHQRLLRAAFEEYGGQEIDTQGDAFFVAFRRARDAALAAVAAQRALGAHPWPEGAELRVRMGIHTGEPALTEDRYHGLGVHRAARIMAAGQGGQILVSQATCSVLEDDELPGAELRDLGEHRLKDLDRPERIYQLVAEGLPHDFPPLRTEEAPTAYTGLEGELAEAAQDAVAHPLLRGQRRRLAAVGALVLAAATAAGVVLAVRSGSAKALGEVDANAVGVIDPTTNKIADEVPVGASPSHLAVGEGALWVTNADDNTVSRIDTVTKQVAQTITVGSGPSGITTGNGAVWVANSLAGTVSRIDPGTNTVVQTIDVGIFPVGVVYAKGSIWVANTGQDTITRIDADSGRPMKTLPIAATELAFGAGTLWASQRTANHVVRIDPKTGNLVQPIVVGNGPTGLAFGSGAAWVANSLDGTVSRIDPATNSVTAAITTGNGATGVAVEGGGVWVSNQFDGTLARIDPRTNQVARRISVGNRPQGVAISGGTVLVSVRQSGAGHRGGTLKVRTNRSTSSFDTAVAYDSTSWSILRMTGDGLVAFNQVGGLQGTQLVPDLAVSLPTPTDGGRTYTFRLRANIRYSNGAAVKPEDFRRAIERVFKLRSGGMGYYAGIAGGTQCATKPKRCDLSHGIVADDAAKTVTFHLVAPDPEFLDKLALPFAYVVPAGTPPREVGTHPLPGTGPYVITSYRPKRLLRLARSKYFHEWSKAAQPDGYPDEIRFAIGGTPDEAVNDVINGKADVFSSSQSQTPPSKGRLAAIETRYASQVHTNPQPATIYLFLNTRLAPFDRLDVRRALNYAADRAAAVEAAGGPDVAQATCQILPPYFPGYRPYCPYTAGAPSGGSWTAPDLAKARSLVARSGTRGMKITVWSWGDLEGFGPYTVKLLRSLGYRASMKVRSGFGYFSVIGDSRTKAQIGTSEWISDYPAASGFFNAILTCASFLPDNPANSNAGEFCDPRIDRQIQRALTEQATNPDAARGLWERVDRQTVDQAPWVPLVNPKVVDVLSKRVGNYQYSPAGLGMLFDQLWVR
ncbi:MAG: ABC transporter substrate-binding protein [Thermoleophilia bacterium]